MKQRQRQLLLLGLLAAAGLGVWWWSQQSADLDYGGDDDAGSGTDDGSDDAGSSAPPLPSSASDDNPVTSDMNAIDTSLQPYASLPTYLQWEPTIAAAAAQYGLPPGLLDNQLYAESGYSAAVISGAQRSSVGAQGIAQFMPATAAGFGVNPLDPSQAIYAAAKYMSQLYRQFNDWNLALAAYNWGQGNVAKWLAAGGSIAAPAETVNYVARITGANLASYA